MEASAASQFLGPFGALILAVVGAIAAGRWLTTRLEKQDEERRAAGARMEALIADNTKAMVAMSEVSRTVAAECRANTVAVEKLVNGIGSKQCPLPIEREHTDPGLRVVQPEKLG